MPATVNARLLTVTWPDLGTRWAILHVRTSIRLSVRSSSPELDCIKRLIVIRWHDKFLRCRTSDISSSVEVLEKPRTEDGLKDFKACGIFRLYLVRIINGKPNKSINPHMTQNTMWPTCFNFAWGTLMYRFWYSNDLAVRFVRHPN